MTGQAKRANFTQTLRSAWLLALFVALSLFAPIAVPAAAPPSLSVSTSSVQSGDVVFISGTGFPANAPIIVWLDTNGNGQVDEDEPVFPIPVQSDALGAFPPLPWVLVDVHAGAFQMLAGTCSHAPAVGLCTGTGTTLTAQTSLTVTMGLSHSKFGGGTTVTVSGFGFSPSSIINVWYDQNPNGTLAGGGTSAASDANGAFSASLVVTGFPGGYFMHASPSSTPAGTIPMHIDSCLFQECTIDDAVTVCMFGLSPADPLSFFSDCKQIDSNYTKPTSKTMGHTPPGGYDFSNRGPSFVGAAALAAALNDVFPPPTGCLALNQALQAASDAGIAVPDSGFDLTKPYNMVDIVCAGPAGGGGPIDYFLYSAQQLLLGNQIPDDGVMIAAIATIQAADPGTRTAAQLVLAQAAVTGAVACGHAGYSCNGSDITNAILQNPDLQQRLIPFSLLQAPFNSPPSPNPCAAVGISGLCWGGMIGWARPVCTQLDPDLQKDSQGNNVGVCERPDSQGNFSQLPVPGTAGSPNNSGADLVCVTGTVNGLSIGYDGDRSFDISGPEILPFVNYHNFLPGPGGSEPPNGLDIEIPVLDEPNFLPQLIALRPGMTVHVCGRWVADMDMLWNELHPITSLSIINPLTIQANDATQVYGAPLPSLTATYSGFQNGDTPESLSGTLVCVTTATQGSPVGSYPITCSGQSSATYTIAYSPGTLTITSAPLVLTANDAKRPYGSANPPFGVTPSGLVNGDTLASIGVTPVCDSPAGVGSSVGTYPITCTGPAESKNYNISYVAGTLTISPTALVITANDATRQYGSANPAFGVSESGLENGDTLASIGVNPTCSSPATATSPVGTYAITCTGPLSTLNYGISYAGGTLTITQAPLSISADSKTKTYGTPNPPLTASYSGLVNGDSPATFNSPPNTPPTLGTTATATSPVGGYPIAVSGAVDPNYSIVFTGGTLTITQAAASVSLATSQTPTVYGSEVTFTATVMDASPNSSGTPTGAVGFYAAGVLLGTNTLSGGVTTLSTFAVPAGAISITGVYSGDANFAASNNNSSPLLQTVTAAPVVSISPDAVTFAPQDVYTTGASMPVVLTNIGTAPLSLGNIQINGSNSSDFLILSTTCPRGLNALGAGASCAVNVAFQPSATGDRMSSLVFTDNDGGSVNMVTQVIGLRGSSLSIASTDFTKQSIAAGNVVWFNSVLSMKGPHGDDGHELDMSQDKVQIFVTQGTISFTSGAQTYSLNVPDGRIILDPTATAASTSFDGMQWITTVPAVSPWNHLQQFDVPGEIFATGLPWLVPAGGLPGGIKRVNWSASYSTDTPGVTLDWEWGAAVYTSLPTDPANYNQIGVKPADDQRGPFKFQNSTNDRAGTPENFKQFWVLGATGDDRGDYTGDWTHDTGVVPSLSFLATAPNPMVFPVVVAAGSSSSPMQLTLTNLNESLGAYISGVTVVDSAEFSVTPASAPCTVGAFMLAPSSTCTFNVVFTPADMGTSTGKVTFTFAPPPGMRQSDAPAPISVDLAGTGMGGPNPIAALSARSLNFPRQRINTTGDPQSILLTNAGGATLTGIGITSNSGEFVIASNSCGATLAPTASCMLSVTFTPSRIGYRTGTLTFTYGNNSGDASQTVSLTGSGSAW